MRADGQTDVTNLIVAFGNFANARKVGVGNIIIIIIIIREGWARQSTTEFY